MNAVKRENTGVHRRLCCFTQSLSDELCREVIPTDKAQTEAFRANEELNAERI
jgi:hypothetical protein